MPWWPRTCNRSRSCAYLVLSILICTASPLMWKQAEHVIFISFSKLPPKEDSAFYLAAVLAIEDAPWLRPEPESSQIAKKSQPLNFATKHRFQIQWDVLSGTWVRGVFAFFPSVCCFFKSFFACHRTCCPAPAARRLCWLQKCSCWRQMGSGMIWAAESDGTFWDHKSRQMFQDPTNTT